MPSNSSALQRLLCLDLYATSRAVTKAYGPLLAALEVTYPQYLVMVALWESEPRTVSQLCQHLSLDSGTLSPLLKRLESAGLVTRSRSREDEREVRIGLTEAGRKLQARSKEVGERIGAVFCLPPDETAELQEVLRGIRARMEASLEQADGAGAAETE